MSPYEMSRAPTLSFPMTTCCLQYLITRLLGGESSSRCR